MPLTGQQVSPAKPDGSASPGAPTPSSGLQWLWDYLKDVRRPRLLDCGPARRSTIDVLLKRAHTLYAADLISPIERAAPELWDYSRKAARFRAEEFVALLPPIPAASLNAAFCWHLLDLLPRDALADLLLKLYLHLEAGGVLFCLLREPYLARGADCRWRLQDLTTLVREGQGQQPFSQPALSNREMERLVPTGTLKTFLTRSGWREVLAVK